MFHVFQALRSLVLVNDLYIGDPLEANIHIPVRLCLFSASEAVSIGHLTLFNPIPQSKSMHIMTRGHIENDASTSC